MTKFFLLDDDPSVTETLKIIIKEKNLGTVCDVAHSAEDALDGLSYLAPDVVIVDLLMPDMDGITFVQRAKSLLPKTAFVMLSQVSDKTMISSAYRAGVDFFIQKPINSIEVISVLQKVMRAQSLERTVDSVQSLFAKVSDTADEEAQAAPEYEARLKKILQRLGIIGERGADDLVTVVNHLCAHEESLNQRTLAEICANYSDSPKTMEQRIRRAATVGLSNIAHLGLDDYANEIFEEYAGSIFRFDQVRKEMDYIKGRSEQRGKVELKKFIMALVNLCMEA